ncbi:MAG: hypothetical protein DWQ40_01360 [Actinobacteria bacterium]|nr:MAG: hypothetical protein DWQ40_01360 [Actinomycetota bacterium]
MSRVIAVFLTGLAILLADWIGLLFAGVAWTVALVQRERRRLEEESGENFENKNSLGLPFTSRW